MFQNAYEYQNLYKWRIQCIMYKDHLVPIIIRYTGRFLSMNWLSEEKIYVLCIYEVFFWQCGL